MTIPHREIIDRWWKIEEWDSVVGDIVFRKRTDTLSNFAGSESWVLVIDDHEYHVPSGLFELLLLKMEKQK